MAGKKKDLDREFEEVEAMAQDGKAGIKATQEIMGAREKKNGELKKQEEEILRQFTNRKVTYNSVLAETLLESLKRADLSGWEFKVAPTDVGVVMELYSPKDKIYRLGFKSTGDPVYDLNAIDVFTQRAENTANIPHTRINGLWTPKKN